MQSESTTDRQSCVLSVRKVNKTFGGVQALRGVDLDLQAGEVHAMVGENGAGKSTLMKVVAGLERAEGGQVLYRGEAIRFRGPHEALSNGIHLIHQELMPFPEMTVAENLFAGREPVRGWLRWIDRGRMRRRTRELLGEVGIDADPDARMGDLTVAQMQGVEIARALAHEVRVLIWDEPTSALSWRETKRLFQIVHRLSRQGVAQVYISHKLDEVFHLANRITVLRDGERVLTCGVGEATPAGLIEAMVGRTVSESFVKARTERRKLLLEVRGLKRSDSSCVEDLRVHGGEIVGLAGLVGAGRTQLVSGLYGLTRSREGTMHFKGRALRVRHPVTALKAGLAMVTEDRQRWGLVSALSVEENLLLSTSAHGSRGWWLDRASERETVRRWTKRLRIKVADASQRVEELSGGNQQ
jgi:ABC-type sugar transport system ATPase subunit